MQQLKGQSRAPDVLDMGTSFAIKADQQGLLAPYKVATWSDIPANAKAADGTWYGDYGGYVAIGYNPAKVKVAPTSFKDLLKPDLQEPGRASTATRPRPARRSPPCTPRRWPTAARSSNIAPGITYFKKLHQEGNFVPVTAGADHGGERPDPDRHLVGLPAGVRDRARRSRASRS